jgi:hypothetical protein
MPSTHGRKRPNPNPYQQEHRQHKPPTYPLPNCHDVNLDFYDPVFRPIFADPTSPHSSMAQTTENHLHSSISPYGLTRATDPAHSDNCSSCCENENCTDQCENEDCTDGCGDCTDACHVDIAHCSLDECKGTVPCPGSPCGPVPSSCPQTASMACQTVVCEDEVCLSATEPCGGECETIYCHDGGCPEECSTEPCEVTCPAFNGAQTSCTDYTCLRDRTGYAPPHHHHHGAQNCVSYHVHSANSSRRQIPHTYHSEVARYASISPDSLTLNTAHSQPFDGLLHHSLFSDRSRFRLSDESTMLLPAAAKRRRISDSTVNTIPAFDHGYSTTPSSAAPTPVPSNLGDIFCMWDDNCEETFFDNLALQDHIQSAHIQPQPVNKRCLWDGCGKESEDPSSLFDHIKTSHAPPPAKLVCMWAGCKAIANSEEELQIHLNTHHLPSAYQCQWDTCDIVIPSETDLEKHVQSQHLLPQLEKTSSTPAGAKICEWQDVDENGTSHVCGLVFPSSTELQQHAKDVHIAALRKRTGYHCHWVGCNRRDKPFSQKGKVERHLQTHTGCKSPCIGLVCQASNQCT